MPEPYSPWGKQIITLDGSLHGPIFAGASQHVLPGTDCNENMVEIGYGILLLQYKHKKGGQNLHRTETTR